jgi:hypothetical protein
MANHFPYVLDESWPAPEPQATPYGYGGLVNLMFGPVQYTGPGDIQVYGSDFFRRLGSTDALQPDPSLPADENTFFFVGAADARVGANTPFPNEDQLWIGSPTSARPFRISFSFTSDAGGTPDVQSVIVAADPSVLPPAVMVQVGGYWVVNLRALTTLQGVYQTSGITYGPGSYLSTDGGSVRVQRTFEEVAVFSPLQPYQFQAVAGSFGALLINPQLRNEKVRRADGKLESVRIRVDYSVLDWRITKDSIRVPEGGGSTIKLSLNSLASSGSPGKGRVDYDGLGMMAPAVSGNLENLDVIMVDRQSAGVIIGGSTDDPTSAYGVNFRTGQVTMQDVDPGVGGTQGWITHFVAGSWTPPSLVTLEGRSLDLLYRGLDEWAMQFHKAASDYRQTGLIGRNGLQPGECYIGASKGIGSPSRIYFPLSDRGHTVTIGEIWYTNSMGSELRVSRDQQFEISGVEALNGVDYAFVNIGDRINNGPTFDFSNGFAVRRITGSTVRVRVLWNSQDFSVANDPVENYRNLEEWMQNTRSVETYRFVQGGTL